MTIDALRNRFNPSIGPNLAGALISYSDSLAIAEPLAKSDPGNAGWRRDLSVSYGRLADAYRKSKDATRTREALTAGRAIVAKLAKDHPDWAQRKQDLVWFDTQFAELKKREGKTNPDKALQKKEETTTVDGARFVISGQRRRLLAWLALWCALLLAALRCADRSESPPSPPERSSSRETGSAVKTKSSPRADVHTARS